MKGAVPAFPFKKRGQVPIFTKIGKKGIITMHISLNSGCKLLFYVEKDYFYCRFLNLIQD